jgi:hypothetical protein
MFRNPTDRVLLTCALAYGVASITSCGGSETNNSSDSGLTVQGTGDGSQGRDVLHLDGANSVDVGLPTVEAGIPDAAVSLDVQTTPDVANADAPVANGDVYMAPVDMPTARPETTPGQADTIFFTRDVPLVPDLPPAVDLSAVDLSIDGPAPVDLAIDGPMPVDLAIDGPGQPDAVPDVPQVQPGTGGFSGGGIVAGRPECYVAGDCTPQATTCLSSTCIFNTCGVVNAPLGTPCQDNGGAVCDGNGSCTASHCSDGVQDADETDVDCGASCDQLGKLCQYSPRQQMCRSGSDCASGVCGAQLLGGAGGADGGGGIDAGGTGPLWCQPPSCSDGVQNGDETDVDCGGSCGATCQSANPQQKCKVPSDCVSSVCSESTPAGNTGGSGGSSGTGGNLGTGGSDGGVDAGGSGQLMCQPPSCFDGVQNGDETDVDCGGSCGATCKFANPQQKCKVPGDCVSGVCSVSAPVPGTGGNGTGGTGGSNIDGGSSTGGAVGSVDGGIDSGASAQLMCQPCASDSDCVQTSLQCGVNDTWLWILGNTMCSGSICTSCPILTADVSNYCGIVQECDFNAALGCDLNSPKCVPHCIDRQSDYDESGVDCGGKDCPGCSIGQGCNGDSDCSSGLGCSTLRNSPTLYTCVDSCLDGHIDGDETDIDCGGTKCTARCSQGQGCKALSDCQPGMYCDGVYFCTFGGGG